MKYAKASQVSASKLRSICTVTVCTMALWFAGNAAADVAAKPEGPVSCKLVTEDGRDLNPRKLKLTKGELCDALLLLHKEIGRELGHTSFVFIVTGGDRYVDAKGVVRSSTNHEPVLDSKPDSMHVRFGAADVHIGAAPTDAITRAVKRTPFAFGYVTNDYKDKHWHLGLRR